MLEMIVRCLGVRCLGMLHIKVGLFYPLHFPPPFSLPSSAEKQGPYMHRNACKAQKYVTHNSGTDTIQSYMKVIIVVINIVTSPLAWASLALHKLTLHMHSLKE